MKELAEKISNLTSQELTELNFELQQMESNVLVYVIDPAKLLSDPHC